jgi:hypothetical protein
LGNDEKTLWNSRLWAGLVVLIVGFIFPFLFYSLDNALDDVCGIDLWTSLGSSNYYLLSEMLPALIMILGLVIVIWGFYKASKR